MILGRGVSVVLVCAGLAGPALAHHSFAMFDRGKTLALTGAVTSFEMVNPHGWLKVAVQDGDKTHTWSLETGPPGVMRRAGWTPMTVAEGDKVTVKLHPMKDGSYAGQLVSVVLPTGKTIAGGPTAGNGED